MRNCYSQILFLSSSVVFYKKLEVCIYGNITGLLCFSYLVLSNYPISLPYRLLLNLQSWTKKNSSLWIKNETLDVKNLILIDYLTPFHCR